MALKPIEHVATILNACSTDQIPPEEAQSSLNLYYHKVANALIKAYHNEDQVKSTLLRNCLEISDDAGLLDRNVYQSFREEFDGIEHTLKESGKWH